MTGRATFRLGPPTRRQFLLGAAAALGASALPACGSNPALHEDALPDFPLDLGEVARAYFGDDLHAARAIGEAYAAEFEGPDAARADLEESFADAAGADDPEGAAAALEEKLGADFEEAAVHSLGGWQFGLTELRAAAVAAITT